MMAFCHTGIVILPIWYLSGPQSFDEAYDTKEGQYRKTGWQSLQAVYRFNKDGQENATWMDDVLRAINPDAVRGAGGCLRRLSQHLADLPVALHLLASCQYQPHPGIHARAHMHAHAHAHAHAHTYTYADAHRNQTETCVSWFCVAQRSRARTHMACGVPGQWPVPVLCGALPFKSA